MIQLEDGGFAMQRYSKDGSKPTDVRGIILKNNQGIIHDEDGNRILKLIQCRPGAPNKPVRFLHIMCMVVQDLSLKKLMDSKVQWVG